jgi:hypothetical protein
VSIEGTPFNVAAEVHPSALAPEDCPGITPPIVLLASQDEDVPMVKSSEAALRGS